MGEIVWMPIDSIYGWRADRSHILLGRWYRKQWIWVAVTEYAGPETWRRTKGSRGNAPTHWGYVYPPEQG